MRMDAIWLHETSEQSRPYCPSPSHGLLGGRPKTGLKVLYSEHACLIYALCVVAAKNYSLRMVQNVLAAASSA